MNFELESMTPTIGAMITGLDLRDPLSDAAWTELNAALLEHHVLFFRDQKIGPEEQLEVARRFGSIDTHAFGRHLSDHPEVGLLDQTDPTRDGANRWHTDSTFMPMPPKLALLRAVKLPKRGGDTCWASMVAAYERLSPAIQECLVGLKAVHDISGPLIRAIAGGHGVGDLEETRAAWPTLSHPVVCRHPETGRRFLYVNSNFTTRIEGVSEAESGALLRFLFDWVRSPEIQVRFRWQPNSIALWDNRCTQHFAVADYQQRRIMHRVTVAGDWSPSATA